MDFTQNSWVELNWVALRCVALSCVALRWVELSWTCPVGPQPARFGHRLNETTSTLNMWGNICDNLWAFLIKMHVLSEISITTTNHAFVHSFVFGQCGSNTNAIFEIDYFCSPYSSYLCRGPASLIFFRVCRLFLRKSWLSHGSGVARLRLPERYKTRRPKNQIENQTTLETNPAQNNFWLFDFAPICHGAAAHAWHRGSGLTNLLQMHKCDKVRQVLQPESFVLGCNLRLPNVLPPSKFCYRGIQ